MPGDQRAQGRAPGAEITPIGGTGPRLVGKIARQRRQPLQHRRAGIVQIHNQNARRRGILRRLHQTIDPVGENPFDPG